MAHRLYRMGWGIVIAALAVAALACSTISGAGVSATAQAIGTEALGGKLLQTAEAIVTESNDGNSAEATAKAVITESAPGTNTAPPDIPVVKGKLENYFSTPGIVSYGTALDFKTVLEFYKKEMPAHKWEALEQESVETQDAAVLRYEQTGRSVTLAISVDPQSNYTIVLITVETR